MGVAEEPNKTLNDNLCMDDYALIKAAFARPRPPRQGSEALLFPRLLYCAQV